MKTLIAVKILAGIGFSTAISGGALGRVIMPASVITAMPSLIPAAGALQVAGIVSTLQFRAAATRIPRATFAHTVDTSFTLLTIAISGTTGNGVTAAVGSHHFPIPTTGRGTATAFTGGLFADFLPLFEKLGDERSSNNGKSNQQNYHDIGYSLR